MPPRNTLERTLVELWERGLGTRPIGIHDDFFELGGTSLLGIQLFTQLPDALKGHLKVADLLIEKTIAGLSGRMSGHDPCALPTGLVLLRPGQGDPIFCPHALLGGAVSVYQPLLAHLPTRRQFYGLVAAGLDGSDFPRRTIESMGAAYLESIKRLQPRGPYRFLGFSTGGLIAFEIAQRLQAVGDSVARLVLLDARAAAEFPESVRRGGYASVLDEFLRPHILQLMPANTPPAEVDPILRVARATAEATFAYEPRPYAGQVVFVSPESVDNPFVYPSTPPEAFWGRMASTLELRKVPGNHYSMMSDANAPALAQVLTPLLDL